MNCKTLFHSYKIKYLVVYIDETLSGNEHCEELTKKLSRANGMLAKASYFVPLLHNIYYATFSSIILYGYQVWGQSSQAVIDKTSLLQKKAVTILTFSNFQAHSNPLFKHFKVKDNIFLQNCLFVFVQD